MLNNSQGVIGLLLGLKSRISTRKPLLTMLAILMVCLFGVNEKAWAYWTTDKDGKTIADNTSKKGYVSNSGSTYYVLDESSQKSKYAGTAFEVSFDEMSLSGPGAKVSFEARRQTAGTGNLALREGDNSGWTKIWEKGVSTSYNSYTAPEEESKKMSPSATKIQFYLPSGSLQKYIKNVKVTMASYCVPETTSVAFGSNTYLTSEEKTLKIYWSNMGNQTISKSGDTDRFTVSTTTVPSTPGYYGNTVIKITYKRDVVGTNHTMKLTINGQEVTVTGTTTKGTPSIDCSQVSATGLTYGQKLSASTISGPNATYKNDSYAGTYSWTRSDASSHTALGCTNYSVTFTPTNTNLNSVTCTSVQVPMTKVAQTITWNQATKYFVDQNATLSASTTGHDASVYFTSGDESIATINGNTVVMHKAGDVVITAHADATCNYNAASTVSHTLQFRNRPTLQWNKIGENDHIYASDTLAHLAYASYGNNTFNLPFEYSVSPAGVLIPTANKDSLIANPELTQEAECIVTASFAGNETYCAINGSHTYKIEPKITPLFKLGEEDLPASPVKRLDLKIGETAYMTFVGTDESNNRFTYPTNAQYVSYTHNSEAHTGVITGTVAGDEEIQFSQTGTTTIFAHERKIHVYVSKHGVMLNELLEEGYEVGDSIAEADMYSVNAPGEGQPDQENVEISSSDETIFKFENGKWRAKNEGNVTITFAQKNTTFWTGDTITVDIHVSKKTPVITWNLNASYPWGAIVETPVSSSNEELPFSVVSNNPSVADYVNGRVEVYNTGEVTFTLSQAGDYKWNAASTNLTKSISCYQPNNHVPFTIASGNKGDIVIYNESHAIWDNNGYKMGDNKWVLKNAPDAYIIIGFTGIPDKLTFTKVCDYYTLGLISELPVDGDCLFEVYESTTNGNWGSPIWSYNQKEESRNVTNVPQLQPSTRYIKLRYYGTVYGRFNNIHISQRKEIVAPANYSFGSATIGNAATERTINADWYNVKTCTVSLSGMNADRFELVDESIASSLDKYGTAGIRVKYKHDVVGSHTATLTITSADDPAKTATVTLTGTTEKAIQEIIWREDITPLPLDEPYSGAAIATSGLAVTLTAETPGILDIEGDRVTGVGVGSTRLFAYQAGDAKWAAVNETITVEVTNKHVQHIIWNDKLNNIKREDGKTVTKTLTAYSDADNTLPITYELDAAAAMFTSLSGNTLTVTGWGTGYITARQAGTDHYVAVSKTMKIVSRDPAAGCDPLVLDEAEAKTLHTIDSETFDLNGEPAELRFEAKCHWDALWGIWVYENVGGSWNQIRYIERLELSTSYQKFTMPVDIRATQIKLAAEVGSTMTRTFKNVEVSLAKYLKLKENNMDFSAVEYGQTVTQQFIIDFSNISGVLDVELANASEQFEIVTETVGEDCGDINHNAIVKVRFKGRTMGTENNTIIISNKDQNLEIPVSATVIPSTQVITWNDADPANVLTTDEVVMTAIATSGETVTFVSSDPTVAEPYNNGDGTWGLTIHKGGNITITAKQAGNDNYDAAPDVVHTYNISRVTPQITTAPTASDLELPNVALSNSTLSGGVASVDGSFAWADETINAALGTYAYTVVFTPDNQDIYAPTTCEVNVKVTKATQTITWDFDQLEMYCNADITFNATASPSGLTVDYTTSDDKIAYVDGDNKLRIIKGGEVTITAIQEGNGTYAAAIPVAKTLNILRETPTVVINPTAAPMKIGKLLSDASLTGGRAELNGVKAEGSFAWKNGNTQKEIVAGEFPRTVIFTPANENYYSPVEFEMNVTVEKYAPAIAFTSLHGSDITYGAPLSMSSFEEDDLTATDTEKVPNEEVAGSFAWKDATEIVNAGTPTMAKAIFTPENQDWYTPVEFNIPVQVAQAEPTLHATAEEIFVVQTLSESHITNEGTPGTCSWAPSLHAETAYYEDGTHTLPYVFVSSDPNYKGGNGTVTLKVYPGCVFVGGNEGGWQTEDNWVKETKPTAGDNVLIKNDVEISSAIEVNALTIANGVDVVVESGATLTVGAGSSIPREHYGNVRVKNGGQMNLGAGELKVNNFVLEAKLGDNTDANPASSGQVDGAEQLAVKGDAYFSISFDPRGAITYGWYDFTVPFEVDVLNGVYDSVGNKLTYNVDYAVMEFSEQRRAANSGKPWVWFSGTMQPGKLYTITLEETKTWNTFLFKKKTGSNIMGSNTYAAAYSNSGETTDRGWNGLGNGTLQHCQLNTLPDQTKIQVNDHINERYVQKEASEYTYAVGTAFFVQVDEATDIDLTSVSENRGFLAPTRYQGRTFDEFRLALSEEGVNEAADRLWVSASEEATGEYTIGRDLLKMGTPTDAKVAQMWTSNNGLNLCDIEMPLVANKAQTSLSIFTPKAGLYEIAVERAPGDATLYLTKNGKAIWNLSMSAYELELEQGTTEDYGLRIVASQQTTTDIEQSEISDQSSVRKVMIDNVIYIVTPEGKMYDIVGKSVNY